MTRGWWPGLAVGTGLHPRHQRGHLRAPWAHLSVGKLRDAQVSIGQHCQPGPRGQRHRRNQPAYNTRIEPSKTADFTGRVRGFHLRDTLP